MKPYYEHGGIVIYHGDCLDVLRKMPAESVDAIVTDPPYGMSYQSARRTDKTSWKPKIANDEHPFIWWLWDAFRVAKDGGALLCFCDWKHQETFRIAIETAGFTVRSHVVWDRECHGMGDLGSTFAPQHDVVWFATKGAFTFPNGRPKSVIRSMRLSGDVLVHPNEKPWATMAKAIASVCPKGGTVLDPFVGSGNTLRAAKDLGCSAIGIDVEQKWCDETAKRLQQEVLLCA